MNNTRLSLTNIQMKNSNGEYVPVSPLSEVEVETKELPFDIDISQPMTISCKLSAKRNGIESEKCLYFMHNKKARIRRKYAKRFARLLGVDISAKS